MPGDKGLDRRFAFFRFLLSPALKKYFGYSFDSLKDIEGPYFLLSNHNCDLDPVFIGMAAGCGIRFVASEHIARRGLLSRLLLATFRPILHTKGRAGITSAREILTALHTGTSVALFPEGNRSFFGQTMPFPEVTGKLARRTGVKLVTWRMEGGYMTQPRWGIGFRRGRLYGRLVHVYQPNELKAMTDDEIKRRIEEDLYEDAFRTQAQLGAHYHCKEPADGLETALYLCPVCKRIGGMKGQGDRFFCTCGANFFLTAGMTLRDGEGRERTIAELAQKQRGDLEALTARCGSDTPLFSDEVSVTFVGRDHKDEKRTAGLLTAYRDRVTFRAKCYRAGDIEGVAIVGRNTLVVHVGEEKRHIEIRAGTSFSALKYENLYRIMKEKERAGE